MIVICNFGACVSTDVRPYMVGPRCSDHTPAAVGEREDPPSRKLATPHLDRGMLRSYTFEYDQTHKRKRK
jgi:hypothetical protein